MRFNIKVEARGLTPSLEARKRSMKLKQLLPAAAFVAAALITFLEGVWIRRPQPR